MVKTAESCHPRNNGAFMGRVIKKSKRWSRKRRKDRSPPIVYTELHLCYFMGLICALRIVDDKAREKGTWQLETRIKKVRRGDGTLIGFEEVLTGDVLPQVDADALVKYSQKIGDLYAQDLYMERSRRRRTAVGLNGSK
jgi:hypothetical protein